MTVVQPEHPPDWTACGEENTEHHWAQQGRAEGGERWCGAKGIDFHTHTTAGWRVEWSASPPSCPCRWEEGKIHVLQLEENNLWLKSWYFLAKKGVNGYWREEAKRAFQQAFHLFPSREGHQYICFLPTNWGCHLHKMISSVNTLHFH